MSRRRRGRKTWGLAGRQRLKSVHVTFSCTWLGGALGLLALQLLATPSGPDELYAVNLCKKVLDDWIIIPSAFGCLGTGLLYGVYTRWGFFEFTWVVAKWVGTVASILFGAIFLGPWVNSLELTSRVSRQVDLMAADPSFSLTNTLVAVFTGVQVATLVALVWISVLKPWSKTGWGGSWWAFWRKEGGG